MKQIDLLECEKANKEHDESPRQFAHVFHHKGAICVAREFFHLPKQFQFGILLHEIGHIALEKEIDHIEKEADDLAYVLTGIKISYRNFGEAKHLQCVKQVYLKSAERILKKIIDCQHSDECENCE